MTDEDDTAPSGEAKSQDAGLTTLLAGWLLMHELADDWIRDAVARGRRPEADPVAQLAADVDDEKVRLRDALSADVGATASPGEVAELNEAIASLGRRLASIEARLDGLSSR
jgi:hypothetical protein